MSHVVLLGDSIFDNARYVPDRPEVIQQVRQSLPAGWRATLVAVDGNVASDVPRQLGRLPRDASHLFISAGGNDALSEITLLGERVSSVAEALALLGDALERFRSDYEQMLRAVLALGKPTAVCTVYDAVPGLEDVAKVALGGFNEVILRAAFQAGLPILDLRFICNQAGDYSHLSAIEPSSVGGAKIARRIAEVATRHDFGLGRSVIYT